MPPGSYSAVTHGDPDDDGDTELVAGEVSTLGKVLVFENLANDTWGAPRLVTAARIRVRAVRVADTNGNDTNEIIVIAGNSDGSKILVYEHVGPPGTHTYNLIYEYSTVSYIFNGSVGDADNDGYPEILIGVGGWHGFPMYIRRIVYDPGTRTYSHRMYEHPSVIGLHLSPLVCDVDSSGDNELVVGSSGDPFGQTHIFKYAGGDVFDWLWSSSMTDEGNVISVQAAAFVDFTCPLVLGAPFSGTVRGFTWNGSTFEDVVYLRPGTGSAIRSIDAAFDLEDELILAESGPADVVSVWRREPASGTGDSRGTRGAPAAVFCPNPSRGSVRFTCPGFRYAEVFDCTGAFVARLSRPQWNDGTGGSAAEPGVYLVRIFRDGPTLSSKLTILK